MNGWEPRIENSIEIINASQVAALHSLLDSGAHEIGVGDVLPPLWHWVALPRWSPSSMIDLDGHPYRGKFLPPIDLPRRMFAGGEVVLHGHLVVGDEVARQSVVESVESKRGRSGSLVIVRVLTTLTSMNGELLLAEHQDLIYRDAAPVTDSIANSKPAGMLSPRGSPLVFDGAAWQFVTDPILLMRFSSATANAHRIHLDWPYTTQVEGYPALVVQGPLSTIVLAEVLRLQVPNRSIVRIQHRNVAPMFCGETANAELALDRSSAEVTLRKGDRTTLSKLCAQFEPEGSPL